MELNPWFISGFIEGEGSFTLSLRPRFQVKQRIDARMVIDAIKETWCFGHVYECSGKPPTQPYVVYDVSKITDLLWIVDHFERWPLVNPRKKEVVLKWSEGVRMLDKNPAHKVTEELMRLSREITQLQCRPRSRR